MKWLFVFGLIGVLGCTDPSEEQTVSIATAANMQLAMEEIGLAFEEQTGIKVSISAASSGTLTNQIRQGAPFDLFISANMRYPNQLFEDGLAVSSPQVYAFGTLIICSSENQPVTTINDLTNPEIDKIAIANPETAPYGMAATEALKMAGILDSVSHKIVYGESIGQVNQYILSGNVDIGLTSASVMGTTEFSQGCWYVEVDRSLYKPIEQGIVKLQHGVNENAAATDLFYDFMFSNSTNDILVKFGYTIKD